MPPSSCCPPPRTALSTTLSAFPSLTLALFPKCPICAAAYLSLFGIASLQNLLFSPWLQLALISLLLLNVTLLFLKSRKTHRYLPFYLALAGALTILLAKLILDSNPTALLGVALTLTASISSTLLHPPGTPHGNAVVIVPLKITSPHSEIPKSQI